MLSVRSLPVSALASGWVGWVELRLPEPFRDCKGRELIIRIASPGVTPRVTIWTYPWYYDAVTQRGGVPLAPDRSVGLLLDAYHYALQK